MALEGGDVGIYPSGNRKLLAPVTDKAVRHKEKEQSLNFQKHLVI